MRKIKLNILILEKILKYSGVFMTYKVEVYLPQCILADIRTALQVIEIGNIGNYTSCMNWYPVKSSWLAKKGSNPYKGSVGKLEEVDEIKLEFTCEEAKLKTVVDIIRNIHPYEEVSINILPLYEL